MNHAITRILLFIVLGLAAVLAWHWVDENGQLRPIVWAAPEPLKPSLESGAPEKLGAMHPDAQQLAELAQRPLFSPSRRPPPPKVPPPPPPPPPPDPLDFTVISGLLTGEEPLVLAKVQGQPRRLKVGGKVGEWELKVVTSEGAQFTKGELNREVTITRISLGSAAPKAAAPSNPVPSDAAPARAAASDNNSVEARQEARRETLRRRNAIRAQRGLPPIPE